MKIRTLFIFIFSVLLLSGCSSYKKVPYLQDEHVMKNIQESRPMHDVKIMPKDLLTITVNTADPEVEVADFFNLDRKSVV